MFTSYRAQKGANRLHIALLSSLCLIMFILSACESTPAISAYTSTDSTPASSVGDTSYIVVGPDPEIIVKSASAAQLTFVASDTQKNISTNGFSLPYTKQGNTVTIDFGETVVHPLEIKIPHAANLSVTLGSGNIVVNSLQGRVAMTLANGTIHMKNFTPLGTDTITSKSGTIDVSFAQNASFHLKAQTKFGAIVSRYSTISQKRSGMQANAVGTIGQASHTMVNLIGEYGSITIGPT
ncbi:MAG: DUF4097 family beta strand repeat protein [Ktedonobacteraceae bacterium]|nr:DUF4097 family beta strand repeat protein [Ktedonobacteraceae bacterium]